MLVWLPYYTRPPRRNTCARDGGPTTISFQITLIAIVEFFEVSLLRVFFLHFCATSVMQAWFTMKKFTSKLSVQVLLI